MSATPNERRAALALLGADCDAIEAAMRARGYPEARAIWHRQAGPIGRGWVMIVYPEGMLKPGEVRGSYGEALAYVEKLPRRQTAEEIAAEIAAWFAVAS